ncbi:MAG: hypothetical protein JW861_02430, partial [Bacteroidales bacterium]|nr:hypothetical protein [Bacteroidales bacterium]
MIIAEYHEYNRSNRVIELFLSSMNERNYKYYASDILRGVIHSPGFDLDASIRKTIAILRLTGLPVQDHFSCIYRSGSLGISRDWRLSELACGLMIISHDSPDRELAEIRYALLNYLG